MLKKMVDGKELICSPEEERVIRMKWDLNTRYPEYVGHLMFDGVNEPKHDMAECKKHHINLVNAEIQKKIDRLNLDIENALENNFVANDLYAKRKALKAQTNPALSKMETVAHLKDHLEKVKSL